MVITYYGAFCFKVQSGDTVLALDPPSRKSNFRAPRFQSDIVFVSSDHEDHNGFGNIAAKESGVEPFLIDGPGEYEIKKVLAGGVSEPRFNTIYRITMDDIALCHLGSFEEKELSAETREVLGKIDVLFAPANQEVLKVINQIEPAVIIPMSKDKKSLDLFLKNLGADKARMLEKFSFKKKDLAGKAGEVIVLRPVMN